MSKEEGRLVAATGIPVQRRQAEGVFLAATGERVVAVECNSQDSPLVSAHGV